MMRVPAIRNSQSAIRHGVVLLAVLVVVVLLTLAAYQYSELMLAELKAADSYERAAQAHAFAESGVHYVAALLANPGSITNPYDSPDLFSGVLVQQGDTPRTTGRFSVISILGPDDILSNGNGQAYRFGLTDETGKINLNTLLALDSSGKTAHDMMMNLQLPNLTEDIINAMLDWIDPDDDPRANGAESSYYSGLAIPYRCKNGPLDTLEELLLVRGVTAQLLYGNDTNRNGTLDNDEDQSSGGIDLGWAPYFTIYSREQNLDSTGNPRLYLNGSDLNSLYQQLTTAVGPDLAKYIVAYRVYGSASGGNSGGGTGGGGGGTGGNRGGATRTMPAGQIPMDQLNLQTGGARARSIASIYELINTTVSIPSQNPQQPAVSYSCPLNDAGMQRTLLPKLLDMVTTVRDAEIQGRINVNTAPRAVLAALPGLQASDVDKIVSRRPFGTGGGDPTDPVFQTPAWLLTEANIPANTLRTLERYITARSQVYRFQVIGYFDGGGPTARIEAVVDVNNGKPRIVSWRDLTELGKGFDFGAMGGGTTTTP